MFNSWQSLVEQVKYDFKNSVTEIKLWMVKWTSHARKSTLFYQLHKPYSVRGI